MKKIISFSLWGNNPKYTIGAIYNAKLAAEIYPGWILRFYISKTVPSNIIDELKSISNVEIVLKNNESNWTSAFWRFEASYDDSVSVVIFRDTDSRLSFREKYAVDEWLKSDKTFHIMRDHPYHRFTILGGMWGYKNNNQYDMQSILTKNNFCNIDQYGIEYVFFQEILNPIIGADKLVHDPFFDKIPFPKPRNGTEFIGDVFDHNNNRDPEFQKHIQPNS